MATAAADPAALPDWRLAIPEPRRRGLRIWFWAIAAMVFAVLVVGGITRLTHSGLSMVDWNPLLGVIPPLSDAQWHALFERYRQFPEYQQLRQGMSLAEFRFIFYWEYTHRLLARGIGVVFLVPLLFFWIRGWFTRPLAGRALALFALGALQGLMGWLMVKSGLVDRPSVSHFRLAAHLSLAFLICGYAIWLARDLALPARRATVARGVRRLLRRGLAITGVLLALQVIWGAFVAGLKAGHFANTFPLIAGRLVPPGLFSRPRWWAGFVQDPLVVQWTHRLLGTLLALAIVGFAISVLKSTAERRSRRLAQALLGLVALQYTLGVLTLLYYVPIPLAAAHQAVALILFGTWVSWLHNSHNLETALQAD